MKYQIKSLCHKGSIRKNNEDAICHATHEVLGITWMIIADGMGGHNAGEVASKMLIEHIKIALEEISYRAPPLWNNWIIAQLNSANLAIIQSAKNNHKLKGMGTTCVLMIIDNAECHLGWVGDSRGYSLKNNNLKQETTDHTMLQALINKGAITAEVAKESKAKSLLSQAIGVKENILVETTRFSIDEGDTVMLSTDGLHDYLTTKEISLYLSQLSAENNVCDDMVHQAISNNSRDNLTIGLINVTK